MSELKRLFTERISTGLARKSITTCSAWARKYRIMGPPFPGPWTFKYHPWLKGMHDSPARVNIGQKAAQMGYTETVLNITFYNIDVKGNDCLYILPAATPDASDFSKARFNPALELSEHLARLFSDVQNVGHKRAGHANLFIRGSRSRSGLKSIPTGIIILDEVDEMEKDNIPLAFERASGQVEKLTWLISTATFSGMGINKYFQDSSQNHFFFPCPSCSKWIELKYPESLIITGESWKDPEINNSHLICYECKSTLSHYNKYEWLSNGQWVEGNTDREIKGWYINQLYSSTVSPIEIAKSVFKAEFDVTEARELWNSKLGLPHEPAGSRITDAQIHSVKSDYSKINPTINPNKFITMGVDVGNWIHYEIDEWSLPPTLYGADLNIASLCKVLTFGKVKSFEEIDLLMYQYNPFCVIDANPEAP